MVQLVNIFLHTDPRRPEIIIDMENGLLDSDASIACCFNISTLNVPPPKVCLIDNSLICLFCILFCCSFHNSRWSNPSKKLPSGDALKNVPVLSGRSPVMVSFSFYQISNLLICGSSL